MASSDPNTKKLPGMDSRLPDDPPKLQAKGGPRVIATLKKRNYIDSGAHPEDALERALNMDTPGLEKLLLKHPSLLTTPDDKFGNVPMHVAASKSNTEMLDFLVRKGADINFQDIYGNGPLHYSVDKEQIPAMKYLLKHGAKVNLPDYRGNTPLHIACRKGNLDMVNLLLLNGADPEALDHSNAKPAEVCRNFECVLSIEREASRRKNGESAGTKVVNWMGFGVGMGIGLGIALAKQQQFYAEQARLEAERKRMAEDAERMKKREEMASMLGTKKQGSGARKFLA